MKTKIPDILLMSNICFITLNKAEDDFVNYIDSSKKNFL